MKSLDGGVLQQMRPPFVSVLALTVIVLLIVCSNVANVLLVRGATRVREIAIRFVLGGATGLDMLTVTTAPFNQSLTRIRGRWTE